MSYLAPQGAGGVGSCHSNTKLTEQKEVSVNFFEEIFYPVLHYVCEMLKEVFKLEYWPMYSLYMYMCSNWNIGLCRLHVYMCSNWNIGLCRLHVYMLVVVTGIEIWLQCVVLKCPVCSMCNSTQHIAVSYCEPAYTSI